MQVEITIPGRPITKKNSQQITYNSRTGKRGLIQSQQYRDYETECLWRLKSYRGPKFKDTKLHVRCKYYMPNRRSWPDLVGLMQATWDILEKAGIIDDDGNIVNPDGTRIVGIDKENPRVEIFIEEME